MIDREAVRSNAKYLRQVRPIDPDEITEYIEGHPHPAVVKQTLREEALDLGLVEQTDGTFVPVDESPVPARGWQPESFPDRYGFALEDLLVRTHGANWHRGESGRTLRQAIRKLKEAYFADDDVEYDETAALGYAIYHLPDYYAVMGYVLETLTERGLLGRTLRILDVGAGTGGPALGLHEYLYGVDVETESEHNGDDTAGKAVDTDGIDPLAALVDYHAVEPSAAADILEHMLSETSRNFRTTVHRTTVEDFNYENALGRTTANAAETAGNNTNAASQTDSTDDTAPFDLICFGNVLNELADPVLAVETALEYLSPKGTIIALEPADLETATGLRSIERAVVSRHDEVTVYAPTLRLWEGREPTDHGWSFDVQPDLAVPGFQHRLDEGQSEDNADTSPGAFVNVDIQFAYSLLRTDGERRFPFRASRSRHAPMATMDEHVTQRINLLAVKLSHNLSEGGNPLFKIGDGSQTVDQYAVLTNESGLNRDLQAAPYGAVLSFENVLVLWNDDKAAYNLVVDAETVVESVSGF